MSGTAIAQTRQEAVAERVKELSLLDWSFKEDRARQHLHEIHPYPAKFIPEIPRRLITALCPQGGVVLDPFCGSGTALAEASISGRRSIGVDISPIAALIARVKSNPLTVDQFAVAEKAIDEVERLTLDSTQLQFGHDASRLASTLEVAEHPDGARGRFRGIEFWFEPHVLSELASLQDAIRGVDDEDVRALLQVALSAIVVQVSKQDSDTRYVRRDKTIAPGDSARRFVLRARATVRAVGDLKVGRNPPGQVTCADSRDLSFLRRESVDFVVTSPPYPNAWSYHLYHQNRMLVLGMNPWTMKAKEIGSHRRYSAKGGSDRGTFLADMSACLRGVQDALRPGGAVCVVIGPSIIRGEVIDNESVIVEAGQAAGLLHLATIRRDIDSRRKAFNPAIGKIRNESIVALWKPE
jgi:DNA modification methylase